MLYPAIIYAKQKAFLLISKWTQTIIAAMCHIIGTVIMLLPYLLISLKVTFFVNVIIINELPYLILLHLPCQTCTCDVNYGWNFFTDELFRGVCWYRCSSRWHLLFIHYYLGVMALSRLIWETLKLTKTYGSNYVLEDTGVKLKSIELV